MLTHVCLVFNIRCFSLKIDFMPNCFSHFQADVLRILNVLHSAALSRLVDATVFRVIPEAFGVPMTLGRAESHQARELVDFASLNGE